MRLGLVGAALVAIMAQTSAARAASATYVLDMTGAVEVPNPGDPDGTATGTLTLDDATGDISWNFTYANINPPTAMHIHGPGGSAGNPANVFVGLGVATSGGPGTLIDSTTTTPANVMSILSNPTVFYVNIHNDPFTGGAVRGQLGTLIPEPGALALAACGGLALALRRRK